MISSFVRALISAFKARCELVPADELNRRHRFANKSETDIEHMVARSEAHDSGLCAADNATPSCAKTRPF